MCAVLAVVVGLLAVGCSSDASSPSATSAAPPTADSRIVPGSAGGAAALWAESDGSLLVGDRLTGRIDRIDPDGAITPVTQVDVVASADDQRGLLGVARLADGRLFASWTRPGDRRLVVGELDGEPERRLVWEGPVSADAANGGRLLAVGGELVVGIGDLLADRGLGDDPEVPNRKILALDPDGTPDQRPRVLSAGWNNPFAIAVADDGVVWVADNTGGDGPERLGRADRPATEATALDGPGEGERAASGLVVRDGRFAVCGYLDRQVEEVRIDGGAVASVELARPCRTGVVRLVDGRLAMGADDGVAITATAWR